MGSKIEHVLDGHTISSPNFNPHPMNRLLNYGSVATHARNIGPHELGNFKNEDRKIVPSGKDKQQLGGFTYRRFSERPY